jgi:hypothetical protein
MQQHAQLYFKDVHNSIHTQPPLFTYFVGWQGESHISKKSVVEYIHIKKTLNVAWNNFLDF